MPTLEERKERERVKKIIDLELLTERMKNTIIELRKELKSLNERYISSKVQIKKRVLALENSAKISDKTIKFKDLEELRQRLEKIESTDSNKSIKDLKRAVLEQQRRRQTQQRTIQKLAGTLVSFKKDVKKVFQEQRQLNTTISKNFEYLTGLVEAIKRKKKELEAAEAMTEISTKGKPESDGSSSSGNKKRKGMRTLKL